MRKGEIERQDGKSGVRRDTGEVLNGALHGIIGRVYCRWVCLAHLDGNVVTH